MYMYIIFQFTAYDHLGRESELPHLQFNENITQFDLTVDNLWTNFSMSRFALEGIMVSNGKTGMKIDETRSIDDEYSPGVFKVGFKVHFHLITRLWFLNIDTDPVISETVL